VATLRRWLPEPLESPAADPPGRCGEFAPACPQATADERERRFRRLGPSGQQESLLGFLSASEREQVIEQVRANVRAELAGQLAADRKEQDARLQHWLENLAGQLSEQARCEREALARQAAALALAAAERIVRRAVQLDREVLVRTLETALHKLEAGTAMIVTAHPEDAASLQSRPELLAKLHIQAIRSDRRIEQGGCMIKSERREWDATIASQLAILGNVVQESLALAECDDV
jgi:flagellar biosynthesis/type III secretory pathway protein FliH